MGARSVRRPLIAVGLVIVVAAPSVVAAEPREAEPIAERPIVVDPNSLPSYRAVPAAPIDLDASGGGSVAAGPDQLRIDPTPVGRPAKATELVDERTEYATVVQSPDGSFTKTVSLGRLNYRDAAGAWQPIDVRLVDDAKDGYRTASARPWSTSGPARPPRSPSAG